MATNASKPEYNSWRAMNERCYNPNYHAYNRYGGRGVTVYDGWRGKGGFQKFYDHIGPKPGPGYTVDRIKNHLPYQPGNVRWGTKHEQSQNRDFCIKITHEGKTMTLAEWGREKCIAYETLRSRIKKGLSTSKLLETGRSRQNPQS